MTEQPGATPDSTDPKPATGDTTNNNPDDNSKPDQPTQDGDKGGKPEDQLGDAGKKALQAQRDEIKQLKSKLGELDGLDIEALKKLASALGGKPSGDTKTDLERLTERLAEVEKSATEERILRLRLEVATDKGLTPAQAARLVGSTREDLAKDADDLLALFPQQQQANGQQQTGGSPRPDPTQGTRGSGDQIDARITEAEQKGDTRLAIALKTQRLAQQQQQTS